VPRTVSNGDIYYILSCILIARVLICLLQHTFSDRWDDLWMGYTECWGHPLLRQEVAKQFYPGLDGDNIRMFSGAEVKQFRIRLLNIL
jgi:hypothetical protein